MTPSDSAVDDVWRLVCDRFESALEGRREDLLTLGNGYMGTRGAAAEARPGGAHYPGTYLAGCYNRPTSAVAGRPVEDEHKVNAPNWLLCEFRTADAAWFVPSVATLIGLPARAGPAARPADPGDGLPRRGRTSHVGASTAAGFDGPPAPGGSADGLHLTELVRPTDRALRSGRRRRQRQRRRVPPAGQPPSGGRVGCGAGRRCRRTGGRHHPVRFADRTGRPHPGEAGARTGKALSAEELRGVFDRIGYPLDAEVVERTVDFYTGRVAHGSTLCRVVHAWVLARADRGRSWPWFGEALRADLDDTQGGTTQEGIHLAVMAGTPSICSCAATRAWRSGTTPYGSIPGFRPRSVGSASTSSTGATASASPSTTMRH